MEFATYVTTHIATCVATEWLGEIFSGMKMGYDDSFLHQKWLNQVFLCKSVCIVISSLIKRKLDGLGGVPTYYKAKVESLAGAEKHEIFHFG